MPTSHVTQQFPFTLGGMFSALMVGWHPCLGVARHEAQDDDRISLSARPADSLISEGLNRNSVPTCLTQMLLWLSIPVIVFQASGITILSGNHHFVAAHVSCSRCLSYCAAREDTTPWRGVITPLHVKEASSRAASAKSRPSTKDSLFPEGCNAETPDTTKSHKNNKEYDNNSM